MNSFFGANSTNSKDRRSTSAPADKGSGFSQTVKDVCASWFPFSPTTSKVPSSQSKTFHADAPENSGSDDWTPFTTASLVAEGRDDDDDDVVKQDDVVEKRQELRSSFRGDTSDTVVGNEDVVNCDDAGDKENNSDRRSCSCSQPVQRNHKFVFDYTSEPYHSPKLMTINGAKQDGDQKEKGEDDAGWTLVDRRNKFGVRSNIGDGDTPSQRMVCDETNSKNTSTEKKVPVLVESRDDVEVEDGREENRDDNLTTRQERNSTFVFDHSGTLKQTTIYADETESMLLFPETALRTADGTTVARSSQRLVSFAPTSQQQHYRDPFRKSRFDFKNEIWYSRLDMKDARIDRDDSIRTFQRSKARTRVLLRLWKRQSQDLALDSPLTKQLLLQLVYLQVGKHTKLHCVGMEKYCAPLMIREQSYRRRALRQAILRAQAHTGPITSSWENLSRVSQQYSAQSRAFALAVGKALDMAVAVEDRLVRDEDDDSNSDDEQV